MKSWHPLKHCEDGTAISFNVYNVLETAVTAVRVVVASSNANSYTNAFAIAQELESFAQSSDVIISGLNTNSTTIFFEGNISAAIYAQYTVNIYAAYDHILVIVPNGLINIEY